MVSVLNEDDTREMRELAKECGVTDTERLYRGMERLVLNVLRRENQGRNVSAELEILAAQNRHLRDCMAKQDKAMEELVSQASKVDASYDEFVALVLPVVHQQVNKQG